jgi:hypothetical protein
MQPLVKVDKVIRFKANKIVRALLDFASARGMSLNEIAGMEFSQDDRCQLAQLIGYSISGYHELSYVSNARAKAASDEAKKIDPNAGGCRDEGCPFHGTI